MRFSSHITYETHHGDDVDIVAQWSVPYFAVVDDRRCHEVEADGIPHVTALWLRIGEHRRSLPLPDADECKHWKTVWSRNERYYETELRERFASAAVEEYWARRSEAA